MQFLFAIYGFTIYYGYEIEKKKTKQDIKYYYKNKENNIYPVYCWNINIKLNKKLFFISNKNKIFYNLYVIYKFI